MQSILSNEPKFAVAEHQTDAVQNVECQINRALEALHQKEVIDQANLKNLSLQSSVMPRMYGLPKTHKPGVPVRPVQSTTGSPCHQPAQWLVRREV
ncbi:hypothetical protein EG68_03657 [Paragonimus skrjabini miyazakii]|uniref:Uncharacterized protein n=1 Tax=Paragonimus skrjabini miyazakii TaxID=59628 RepID=A0A8S9YYB1_9TREM|nr:hypothetical protein EG68_03657 [Paragonimus skrjabini miyazakii]